MEIARMNLTYNKENESYGLSFIHLDSTIEINKEIYETLNKFRDSKGRIERTIPYGAWTYKDLSKEEYLKIIECIASICCNLEYPLTHESRAGYFLRTGNQMSY